MPRRRPALVARACAVAVTAAAFAVVPLPRVAYATVTTTRTAEVVTSVPAGRRVVALPFAAHHVALHWAGAPDADVEVAFRTGAGPWRATYHAGRDDGSGTGGRTRSTVLGARDATAVLVTSDRALVDLRVVAFGEGERRRVPVPASAGTAAAADQPDVIDRAEWDPANECSPKNPPSFAPIEKLAVHHTAGGEAADPRTTIKAICLFHQNSRNFNDIGYNFLVDSAGRVYEGRWARSYAPGEEPTGENLAKEGVTGAHIEDFNTGSVGVALLGDFTASPPTEAARAGLVGLLAWKAERHDLDPLASSVFKSKDLPNIFGHRDAGSTACPGDAFHPQLPLVRQEVADRIAATEAGGEYTAVTPWRARDTRSTAAVGPGRTIDVKVTGAGGVPASGVSAIAVNVTAVAPTGSGYLTVHPAGEPRPLASAISFAARRTVAGFVKAKVNSAGSISVFNSAGTTHVLVDVVGWYAPSDGIVYRGLYTPLSKPVRFLDTRSSGPVGPRGTAYVQAVQGGVAPDATALALNVTVTRPTGTSYLTLWPAGVARPTASNLNFVPGQTVANAAVVGIGQDGRIAAYNFGGEVHVVVDVVGYFAPPMPGLARYRPLSPARILDTRRALGMPAALGPGGTGELTVLGAGGVPAETAVTGVVLNVTVTGPTASGYLTVWPSGEQRPLASTLNFGPAQTVANLVIARVGAGGRVSFYNPAGTTHVIADVVGFYVAD